MGTPWKHHGRQHGHRRIPAGLVIFPTLMVASAVVSVFIAKRMLCALQTLTDATVLKELGDRLPEAERAELERRVRDRLFECNIFGCCHQ